LALCIGAVLSPDGTANRQAGSDAAVGFEVQIALDGKTEFAADGLQFDQADVTDLSVFT
jgi:hypothetical protein